jgi:hypothetical protein
MAHTYWSVGPSWFNEGMADIYAILAIEEMSKNPPAAWRGIDADLEGHYRSRKAQVEAGRFPPNLTLPQRLASDGLYEVADVFLLELRQQIGAEAFIETARQVYLASDFGRYHLREKRIEDMLLAAAQPGARDEVKALFNRFVWGDNGERYRELQELDAP